ncbi:MAG: alkaline phosphatase family protein, partial [Actinobacteria bacterium]|nr:alkaline phosphatase family protein [Actinomycetota bacterium]
MRYATLRSSSSPVRLAVAAAALVVLAACVSDRPPPSTKGQKLGSRDKAPPAPGHVSRGCAQLDELVLRVRRGYTGTSSPDISLIPSVPNYVGSDSSPVHSGPWDYLANVPLVLYGPGHIRPAGALSGPATMTDLAPTAAQLIGFEGWPQRKGRVLTEALVGEPKAPPRLVATIVWDGGGLNALREHPHAWPYLRRLMTEGASYGDMTIGSSPSVTPPIHTTLGTGAWPAQHGIPALRSRTADGLYVDPFEGLDPSRIELATLADLYDRASGNRPVTGALGAIGWHLGMIGKGAAFPGGDKDPVVLLNYAGVTLSNESIYTLPPVGNAAMLEAFTQALDRDDGKSDGGWRGHDLAIDTVRYASPAHAAYHQWVLERLVASEGFGGDPVPDLLYVNFKTPDDAGHTWGLTSPETGDALEATDDALKRFVRFLNATVGRGRWVVMVTADHGQMPYPHESGGWAIAGYELFEDANAALDKTDNGIDLVEFVKSAGMYVRRDDLEPNGVTLKDIAEWAVDYRVEDNLKDGESIPAAFRGEPGDHLFD